MCSSWTVSLYTRLVWRSLWWWYAHAQNQPCLYPIIKYYQCLRFMRMYQVLKQHAICDLVFGNLFSYWCGILTWHPVWTSLLLQYFPAEKVGTRLFYFLSYGLIHACSFNTLLTIAICSTPCQNEGRCVAPDLCDCASAQGWRGQHCQEGM